MATVKHDAGCMEWCNHCEMCGVGILYGSRCPDHPNTAGWSEAHRESVDSGKGAERG